MTKSLAVFLDASVLLAGMGSPTGGSAKILKAAQIKKLKTIATPKVIQETVKHLHKLNLTPPNLETLLKKKVVHLSPAPPQGIIEKFSSVTDDPDDAHVLAGAVISGSNVLISLDQKHIVTPRVRKALKPIEVVTPKQFWAKLGRSL